MNTMIKTTKSLPLGKLALGICLIGVLLPVVISLFTWVIGEQAPALACFLFVAFQVIALVLGFISRSEPMGRTSAIASGILLLLAVLSMPFLSLGGTSPQPSLTTTMEGVESNTK